MRSTTIVQKKFKKVIGNQISFLMGRKWKVSAPTRLQLPEPGPRGGVGEGSVNYVYRIIVTVFTGS